MLTHKLRAPAAVIALAFVAGCGGGTNTVPSRPAAPATHGKSTVTVKVKIPRAAARANSSQRTPKFVSPATAGVLVQVYATNSTQPLLASSATDVSSGSAACAAPDVSGSRECTVLIPAPVGTDDFVFTTYSAPPDANGNFNAPVLGTGTVTQTIASATQNVVSVTLGGLIEGLAPLDDISLAAANGPGWTVPIPVRAIDASGYSIIADPFANGGTIVATLSETAGSDATVNHAYLVLNDATIALTETLASGADNLKVHYDGLGSPGYFATVTFTASNVTGTPAINVNPFYITSGDPLFTAGPVPAVALV